MSYGLGLMVGDDHGVQFVGHGGNTAGFTSEMFFLPEHHVGIVILTNAGGANMFTAAVQRKLMEILFDGKDQAQSMISIRVDQYKTAIKQNLENINLQPDATQLSKFVGSYTHPVLGLIEIHQTGDIFELDARVWKSKLGQKTEEDGTLVLITIDAPLQGFDFLPKEDAAGKVTQLIFDDGQHKYIFERQ